VDLGPFATGDYILRTDAIDLRGNARTLDRVITVAERSSQAPSVSRTYPQANDTNVPGNAPTVVQFDAEMNPAAVTTQTFNLRSEKGALYKDAIYDYTTRTLTLNPPTRYDSLRFHYAVVNSEFHSQQGHRLGGDFAFAFTTAPAGPSGTIAEISPIRGEAGVRLDRPIVIEYTEPSPYLHVSLTDLAGRGVDLDSSVLDASRYTLTVYPRVLAPKSYYLIRVSDHPDVNGPADYMSYFITEDTQMPVLMESSPAHRSWLVALDQEVRLVFNKPLNTRTVDSSSFYVLGPEGKVGGFIQFGATSDSILSFAPDAPYRPATEYTVVASSHIQDNIGNYIDSTSWTFTTGVFDTVGFAGGIVSAGGFEVYFPQGALPSEVTVGLGVIPAGVLQPGPMLGFTDMAVDMEPATTLTRDAILSVAVPDSIATAHGGMSVFAFQAYDSSLAEWSFLGGSASGNRISLSINRLGRYGLFASAPQAAAVDFESSVALIPRVINPKRGAGTGNNQLNVSYKISQATQVTAKIYSRRGRLVKTLESSYLSTVGDQLLRWDGRGDDGSYADDGIYVLVIEAEGKQVQKTFVVLNK
jgi:hypothetical protein